MKPIVLIPHTVLSSYAKTVDVFDNALASFVEEMKQTLLATTNPKGVGLAAPQVCESLRIFITKPTATAKIRVFINPVIAHHASEVADEAPEQEDKLEGCLSIPNIWGKVHRTKTLTLTYQDLKGKIHTEQFKGFLAIIIQHETDHINGILFTQRVLEQKNKMYQVAYDEDGKEVLDEIPI